MNGKSWVVGLSLSITMLSCVKNPSPVDNPYVGKALDSRFTLVGAAAAHYKPEDLIGRMLYKKRDGGMCPSENMHILNETGLGLNRYLVQNAEFNAEPISEKWFEAKERIEGNESAVLPMFGIDLKGTYAAEWIMTDTVKVHGYDVLDKAAIKDLADTPMNPKYCARYVVTDVVISVLHFRRFYEVSNKHSIIGMAFKVDGGLATSNEVFEVQPFIGLDVLDLSRIADDAGKLAKVGDNSPLVSFTQTSPGMKILDSSASAPRAVFKADSDGGPLRFLDSEFEIIDDTKVMPE